MTAYTPVSFNAEDTAAVQLVALNTLTPVRSGDKAISWQQGERVYVTIIQSQ